MAIEVIDYPLPSLTALGWPNRAHTSAIAVHHIDAGPPVHTFSAERARVDSVNAYHIGLGFGGIGYHALAFTSGRVWTFGAFYEPRAGIANHNRSTYHVALDGNFMTTAPTHMQLAAAQHAITIARNTHQGILPVFGHREIAAPGWATACPGDTFAEWVPLLDAGAIAMNEEVNMDDRFARIETDIAQLWATIEELYELLASVNPLTSEDISGLNSLLKRLARVRDAWTTT